MRLLAPLAALLMAASASCAMAQDATAQDATAPETASEQNVVRHGRPGALLLESVEVGPGARYLYIGGHAAALLDPEDPSKGYGDTRTQTFSTLGKIKTALERRGFAMSDLIKLTIYVVADPATGQADYAGVNAAYREFFLTEENPNTVSRTAIEIKAIQVPALLVEIEGVAAR